MMQKSINKKHKGCNEQVLFDKSTYEYNVFVMMRYREESYYETIERSIRSSLGKNGLNAYMAKDRAIFDSLWDNVKHYMDNCKYGIAVFEEIDVREFNPNISIELGYMFGQNKRCLILKEERMKKLPTNICGQICRTFDKFKIESSIEREIDNWVKYDINMQYVNKISKIFSQKDNLNIKLRKVLEMLYEKRSPMNSHEIEKNLGYHSGDSATQIHSIILRLKSSELIQYEEDNITYGRYWLPQNIIKVLSSYME